MRHAFGVVVLKQILPFKPGPYAQALDLRPSGLRRHVILGRVEGTGESGQGRRLKMPLPLPGPTGLWEGTGRRCSGLLLAVDLGLRQGLQKKHSGAPP